ncbi:MAG: hypothetical protein SPL86_08830, partial [Succiniclasticum sp.]|uniref:hypothetical protein n=1 Tax=Succiniclasticum sp. TaxID=2775030 RepID=UPI002A92023C
MHSISDEHTSKACGSLLIPRDRFDGIPLARSPSVRRDGANPSGITSDAQRGIAPCGNATLIQAASARASMISLCCLGIMQTGEGMSKPSAAITLFHEMKFAVVARLFEGR